MERNVNIYFGYDTIISSLGNGTSENYACIDSYTTRGNNLSDETPLLLINRETIEHTDGNDLSFVEHISVMALSDILSRSGLSLANARTQLIISTTKGNIDALNTDPDRCYLWETAKRMTSHFGCFNRPIVVSNACISGLSAIVIGSRLIEEGRYDHVFVVGIDLASAFVVSGFNSFKSISPTVCRPYDSARDGLTLGEGCGALLLTKDRTLSPSKIVMAGGALTDDANHISAPSRSGDGLFHAITGALQSANLTYDNIDFVNCHGTGTPYNDEMESKALKLASLNSTPCNSLKPYLGHTLGASGVIETILSVAQLANNHLFGIPGYENNGVPYELNVSAKHRDFEMRHCLKTASGFGGTNGAIVISKEEHHKQNDRSTDKVAIVEAGHIEINKQPEIPFSEHIRREYKALGESNLKFFKMDNLSKLGYVASCKLMKGVMLPFAPNRIGVVLSNRSSSLDTDIKHQQLVNQHLPEGTSPAVFVYTLANIAAAEIAIKHHFGGELTVFIHEQKDMDNTFVYAKRLIETGICDAVLYGWCELLGEEYNAELKLIKRI